MSWSGENSDLDSYNRKPTGRRTGVWRACRTWSWYVLPINLMLSCTCQTVNCCLRLLYFYGTCAHEGGAVGTCWMAPGLFNQVLAAEGSTIEEVSSKPSSGGKVWHHTGLFFLLSRRYMMDTVTWIAGQLKSGRERPGSVWQQCERDGD